MEEARHVSSTFVIIDGGCRWRKRRLRSCGTELGSWVTELRSCGVAEFDLGAAPIWKPERRASASVFEVGGLAASLLHFKDQRGFFLPLGIVRYKQQL